MRSKYWSWGGEAVWGLRRRSEGWVWVLQGAVSRLVCLQGAGSIFRGFQSGVRSGFGGSLSQEAVVIVVGIRTGAFVEG